MRINGHEGAARTTDPRVGRPPGATRRASGAAARDAGGRERVANRVSLRRQRIARAALVQGDGALGVVAAERV